MKSFSKIVLVSLIILSFSACSKIRPVDHVINMPDRHRYEPDSLVIKNGETVKWVNDSKYRHTVTCDPEKVIKPGNVQLPEGAEPISSGNIGPGESFTYTFTTTGRYKYFCIPHELVGMTGQIIVEE